MKLNELIEELNCICEFAEERRVRTHVASYDEYLEVTLFVVEYSEYKKEDEIKVDSIFDEYTKYGIKDNMSVSVNFNEIEIKLYLDK